MDPRQAARFLQDCADRAAQKTAAMRRANVSDVLEDGRGVVTLANGARVIVSRPATFNLSQQQALTLVRQGGRWEPLTPSAYQGGLGAPVSPEP